MVHFRRLAKIAPIIVLVALVVPSAAFGQATRTWVSGVGDDANPCSRTAPCKTFAGAISKTANGGEINAIDPGGFGGVTITKSITINGRGQLAGALVSGTNAIVINAGATDEVTIKNLDINGIGTGAPTSLTGIKVLSARSVRIMDNDIYRFRAGIAVVPTSPLTRVLIARNDITDNGVGVVIAPGNNLITSAMATLRKNEIHDNTCGLLVGSGGTTSSTPDAGAAECGLAAPGAINKPVTMGLYRNGIHDNGTGLQARGAQAVAEIAHNEITGSTTRAMRRTDSAIIRTFGNNIISNNQAAGDAPNATATAG